MKFPMDEILRLTVQERIDLIGAIWDSIEGAHGGAPVSEAQRAEIERRWRLYLDEPQRTSSWDEVRERLSQDD